MKPVGTRGDEFNFCPSTARLYNRRSQRVTRVIDKSDEGTYLQSKRNLVSAGDWLCTHKFGTFRCIAAQSWKTLKNGTAKFVESSLTQLRVYRFC